MRVLNKSLNRVELTRVKKTTLKFTAPKKEINKENMKIDFEGHYLVISREDTCKKYL